MSRSRSLAVLFAIALGGASFAFADEKPIEIPLKQIWAYAMHGTRDISELDPPPVAGQTESERVEQSLSTKIMRSLIRRRGKSAGKGFAVSGTGREALHAAYSTLVEKQKRKATLPPGEITLVIYSHPIARYLELDSVIRESGRVLVKYHLIPHKTKDATIHLALIPLGKLPEGTEVDVEMVEVLRPLDANIPPMSKEEKRQAISGSFSFDVSL